MRKLISIAITFSLSACLLIGCGKDEPVAEASQDEFQQETDALQQIQDLATDTIIENTEDAINDMQEGVERYEEEKAEAEANAQDIKVTDNKIYDKNGILITLDEINNLRAIVTVKNDNPDNKKIQMLALKYIGLNGICPSIATEASINGIPVGETGSIEFDLTNCAFYKDFAFDYDDTTDIIMYEPLIDGMHNKYSKLGAPDMPIETVDFDFELGLGENDTVVEQIHSSLHTTDYKDGDLSSYWGERKDSLTFEADEFNEYLNTAPNGPFDIYVNSNMSDSGIISLIFAGKYDTGADYEITDNYLYINNRELNCFQHNPTIRGEGFIDVFTLEKDPTQIRKDFEIPNNEPIELKVAFKVNGEAYSYDLGSFPPQ